jgi:hypothetical protein
MLSPHPAPPIDRRQSQRAPPAVYTGQRRAAMGHEEAHHVALCGPRTRAAGGTVLRAGCTSYPMRSVW